MSLMEMFGNPEMIDQLSMGEKLLGGLITTLMGLGTTFLVLLLLWVIIALISKMINGSENRGKPQGGAKQEAAPVAAVAAAPAQETMAESELIAVIMAAIAAVEGKGVASNLNVKRISRISGNAPSWSAAGRVECIDSRR